jgi:argininosuccinate lyase
MDDTGRIKKGIHPAIKKIIFGEVTTDEDRAELSLISKIDKAHVLMLAHQNLIPEQHAAQILAEISKLEQENFEPLIGVPAPRGAYLLYESFLISRLGMLVAGSIHLGRSRNDINATIAMLQTRSGIKEVLNQLLDLLDLITDLSKEYSSVIMPAYTHFQPAVPVTYGHYLQGIGISLRKNIEEFIHTLKNLNNSALGSCSVGGTSVPIESALTAELLGFETGPLNSIEAVASRDFWLHFLSKISITSTLISRIAADMLLWNTQEFNFFKLEDEITGSSSIMPNKKNPFVLENIQGKAGAVTAAFNSGLTAMHKSPFTNSITVGTESKMFLNQAKKEFIDAVQLLCIFLSYAKPNEEQMRLRALQGHTMATEIANTLTIEHKVPFRESHFILGEAVRETVAAADLCDARVLKDYKLKTSLEKTVEDSRYGGGPAKINLETNYLILKDYVKKVECLLNGLENKWKSADEKIKALAEELDKLNV